MSDDMPRCATCRWWRPIPKAEAVWGICALTVVHGTDPTYTATLAHPVWSDDGVTFALDVAELVTHSTFGCVQHDRSDR